MGISLVRMNSYWELFNNFGYIDHIETDIIITEAKKNSLKCLKFLDQCDDAIFNHKQLKEIANELQTLKQNLAINQKTISMITYGLEETLKHPDQFLAFIGD